MVTNLASSVDACRLPRLKGAADTWRGCPVTGTLPTKIRSRQVPGERSVIVPFTGPGWGETLVVWAPPA